jgi:predicted transcriptional regulator
VRCDRSGFAHRFAAKVTRQAYVGRQLAQLAENHFQGALAPMLLTLVDRIDLSKKDREAIRKIIEGIK